MARKLFIAGNWKMNLDHAGALDLAGGLRGLIGSIDKVDLAVFPPFVFLPAVREALVGSEIELGAQNLYFQDKGAYTGEISAAMLTDIGCRYVILGHSERRHVLGETDETVNRKVVQALNHGLDVILCVGELLEEREADRTTEVVSRQVKIGLEGVARSHADGLTLADRLTIAYEPVWAIGTGRTATPQTAQEVHKTIRALVGELYDAEIAGDIRIQYGGSVKPDNAADMLAQADIDGALVGGASLNAADFSKIVRAGI